MRDVPKPSGSWGQVIDSVFEIDPEKVYRQLVADLNEDRPSGVGALIQASHVADSNAFLAVRLVRAAKLEEERYSAEADAQLAILRERARNELAKDKEEGKIARAPSQADVDDRVRINWPDRVSSIRSERAKLHGALRACEGLLESWRERSRTLRAMITGFRRHS